METAVSRESLEKRIEELEKKVAELDVYDSVTGVHNRKAFLKRLAEEIEHVGRYGKRKNILIIKLPALETLHGADTVDGLPKAFADKLRQTLRQSDYPARLDSWTFAVILENLDTACPASVIMRIRTAVSSLEIKQNTGDFIRPAFGCSAFPDDGDTPAALIDHAMKMAGCCDG